MKTTLLWMVTVGAVLGAAHLCHGHACDDPWRPNPGNVGSAPTGPGAPGSALPPPPPPAPGEQPNPGGAPVGPNSGPGLTNRLLPGGNDPGAGGETSPDHIVLIPETSQLKIIGRKGEFRTYVVNKAPRDLFDVRLEAVSPAFETEVDPESIRRLVSGERDYYTVKLVLKGELKSGRFPMDFKVTSRGATIYEGSLDKPAAEAPAANLSLRLSRVPKTFGKTGSFYVLVKNNVFNEVNNVQVSIPSGPFNVKIEPASVAKLSPGQEAEFKVTTTLKKGVANGPHTLHLDARTSSRNVFAAQDVKLEVKK